ncbi:MAG: hypothetical protein AB7I79_22220 [Rhizobiaceae bacterium]
MTPERLVTLQPSRVSASRALINRAMRDRWSICRSLFDIDSGGSGTAKYQIDIGGWPFTFIVYSFEPQKAGRTDRIIGSAWDMMAALVEGDMSAADVERTREELPRLYEGRATPGTLIWCRSNRSSRLFNHVVESLASGNQPDTTLLASAGYAMRNTGIDGNGTFGTKTFLAYEKDHPLRWSLAAQMLSAYMMRVFAVDLLNTLARQAAAVSAELAPEIARYLGIGNASGLGLVLFVNNHPRVIDRWLTIRERALYAAKQLNLSSDAQPLDLLVRLVEKAIVFRRQDRLRYEVFESSGQIADDLEQVRELLQRERQKIRENPHVPRSLGPICEDLSDRICAAALETLHSLMIELVPDFADGLVDSLALEEELDSSPQMRVGELKRVIEEEYRWVFGADLSSERSRRFIWYKSRAAEEPRRGPREELSESAVNLGLDLPRLVVGLFEDLRRADSRDSTARFLAQHPWHRAIGIRVQSLAGSPYHSFWGDMMSDGFTPAHIIHLMNAGVHGIDKAQDYLGRWVRGVLFHGAPLAEELGSGQAEQHWFYPAEPST